MDAFRDLPMGFSMALVQNKRAYEHFEHLSEVEKAEILDKTSQINSKQEMKSYVDSFGKSIG